MQYKILITGAAGFIGSTLAKKAIEEKDWEVWALDNNFRYSFDFLKNINSAKLHIVKADICDSVKISDVLKENFDFIVHLAAIPGERLCKIYPEETIRTNIYGTKVLLDKALKYKIKGFLFASSQVIYGEPKELPIIEEHKASPYDLYSFSKAADELLLNDYRKKGLPLVVLRFSSVYGHGIFARWSEVLGRFVKLAYEDNCLTIYKPFNLSKAGEQVVDLIHVNDVSDGIIESIKNINKTSGNIYNLSYGRAYSILQIAELVKSICNERLNKNLEFRYLETKEEEMSKLEVSNEKIKKELNWEPKISIKEGINELFDKYAFYKEKFGELLEPALIKTPTREQL